MSAAPAGQVPALQTQNHFADVGAGFQIAVGGGDVGEGKHAVQDYFHATGFQERPDVLLQLARDLRFVGDGAGPHGGAGEGQALLHDLRQVDGGFGALLHRDLYQAAARREALDIARRVGGADHVEDEIYAPGLGHEILLAIIDRAGAESFAGAALFCGARGGEHGRAKFTSKLDRGGADAARSTVHENPLARLEAADLENVGPYGEIILGDARSLFDGEAGGHGQTVRIGRDTVFRVTA